MGAERQSPTSMSGWLGYLARSFRLRVLHFGFISEGEVHTEEMADRQTDSLDYGLLYTNISTPLLSDQILTCCYVRSAIIIASAVTLSKEISSPLFDFWMPYRWDAAFEEWLQCLHAMVSFVFRS